MEPQNLAVGIIWDDLHPITSIGGRSMFDSAFLQAYASREMKTGPVGPFLPQYVAFLQQHRYSFCTIKCSIRAACVFSRWLEREHLTLDQLSENVLARYRDPFRRKNVKPSLPTEVAGLPKLLIWLREQGVVPEPGQPDQTEQEKWPSVATPKPAMCGHLKTGHRKQRLGH
jgi:hypothetical protein